jgi:hypothetical protein
MRIRGTPAALGLCLFGMGCTFVPNIERNIIVEPARFCNDEKLFKRSRQQAAEAWNELLSQYPEAGEYSCHYHDGFVEGFADYLNFGGKGEPPNVPPPRYRRAKYATPEGYRAIEEWFMGFRHGAATAHASGLRQLVTLPTVIPPDPYAVDTNPTDPGEADTLPGNAPPGGVTLPAPRVAPEAPALGPAPAPAVAPPPPPPVPGSGGR